MDNPARAVLVPLISQWVDLQKQCRARCHRGPSLLVSAEMGNGALQGTSIVKLLEKAILKLLGPAPYTLLGAVERCQNRADLTQCTQPKKRLSGKGGCNCEGYNLPLNNRTPQHNTGRSNNRNLQKCNHVEGWGAPTGIRRQQQIWTMQSNVTVCCVPWGLFESLAHSLYRHYTCANTPDPKNYRGNQDFFF